MKEKRDDETQERKRSEGKNRLGKEPTHEQVYLLVNDRYSTTDYRGAADTEFCMNLLSRSPSPGRSDFLFLRVRLSKHTRLRCRRASMNSHFYSW